MAKYYKYFMIKKNITRNENDTLRWFMINWLDLVNLMQLPQTHKINFILIGIDSSHYNMWIEINLYLGILFRPGWNCKIYSDLLPNVSDFSIAFPFSK